MGKRESKIKINLIKFEQYIYMNVGFFSELCIKTILKKKNNFIHFSDFLELSWSIIAADFTHRERGVEKFNKALGMQLQIAEQRFHT